METPEFADIYEKKLASSLVASRMIGNLYTASLYLGFRSSLEYEHRKGVDLAGKRVGFGSYGSGSSAMVFSGVILDRYEEVIRNMHFQSDMEERRKLTLEEYEMLHRGQMPISEAVLPDSEGFVLSNVDKANGERSYVYNP